MKDQTSTLGDTATEPAADSKQPPEGQAVNAVELLDQNLDETNPDDVILAHPEWGSIAMAAMAASFDTVVPAAMLAANYTIFRNADLYGEGSSNDGTGTLENAFRARFEGLDENGQPKNKDGLLDEFAEIVANVQEDERREQEKRDLEATFTESQIDAMNWVGDPDAVWDMGGVTASRRDLLAGAKAARKGLKKLATDKGWSDDQLIHETRLVSDYERAIIENRPADAARAKQQMQPDTRERIDQDKRKAVSANKDVSPEVAGAATSAKSTMTDSTNAGSDALSQITSADRMLLKPEIKAALASDVEREPALSHPPAIELTADFTIAASPSSECAAPKPKPAEVANAAPVTTPTLNQSFSI